MYRACFDVEISDRENPAKSQSLSAGSVVLVIWNHIYGKCFSSFGLEINTLLGENIFTVGEKTGFSWFFQNLISIIWELREKEHNVTSITFFWREICVKSSKYFCSVKCPARFCPCFLIPFSWVLISLMCISISFVMWEKMAAVICCNC